MSVGQIVVIISVLLDYICVLNFSEGTRFFVLSSQSHFVCYNCSMNMFSFPFVSQLVRIFVSAVTFSTVILFRSVPFLF